MLIYKGVNNKCTNCDFVNKLWFFRCRICNQRLWGRPQFVMIGLFGVILFSITLLSFDLFSMGETWVYEKEGEYDIKSDADVIRTRKRNSTAPRRRRVRSRGYGGGKTTLGDGKRRRRGRSASDPPDSQRRRPRNTPDESGDRPDN